MSKNTNSSSPVLISLFIILGIGLAGILLAGYAVMPKKTNENNVINQAIIPTVTEIPVPTEPFMPVSQGISLTITAPEDQSLVTKNTIVVRGTTAPRAEVFVNDKIVAANAQGNFSVSIILDEGENIISIVANDAEGNYATQEVRVTYEIAE